VRKKYQKLCTDDTPMVRRAGAQCIGELAKQLEHDIATTYLLPILQKLLQDENDSVKIHAVASSLDVAGVLGDKQKIATEILPELVKCS